MVCRWLARQSIARPITLLRSRLTRQPTTGICLYESRVRRIFHGNGYFSLQSCQFSDWPAEVISDCFCAASTVHRKQAENLFASSETFRLQLDTDLKVSPRRLRSGDLWPSQVAVCALAPRGASRLIAPDTTPNQSFFASCILSSCRPCFFFRLCYWFFEAGRKRLCLLS